MVSMLTGQTDRQTDRRQTVTLCFLLHADSVKSYVLHVRSDYIQAHCVHTTADSYVPTYYLPIVMSLITANQPICNRAGNKSRFSRIHFIGRYANSRFTDIMVCACLVPQSLASKSPTYLAADIPLVSEHDRRCLIHRYTLYQNS